MKCLITYTSSTEGEDFFGHGADAKVSDLESASITLEKLFQPIQESEEAQIRI